MRRELHLTRVRVPTHVSSMARSRTLGAGRLVLLQPPRRPALGEGMAAGFAGCGVGDWDFLA
jgi:hypothetical protein